MNEFDQRRQQANWELLTLVQDFLAEYPTLRFGQALVNLDIVKGDPFYDEPTAALDRARAALIRMGGAK